jgi:hypothetical protein
MFHKKNLKSLLSLIIFFAAIGSVTMLQGFSQGPKKGHISVQTEGINNPSCILLATNIDNPSDQFTMTLHSSNEGNGVYYKAGLEYKSRYLVTLCFQDDGGNVQVIVKDGEFDPRDSDILYPSPNSCE